MNEAFEKSKNAIEGAFEGSIAEAENLAESIYGGKCLTDSNCSAVSFCDGNTWFDCHKTYINSINFNSWNLMRLVSSI